MKDGTLRRRKTVQVIVYMTPEEKRVIKAGAGLSEQATLGGFIREAALDRARKLRTREYERKEEGV